MPHLTTDDGVKLYYEETGTGTPVVFVHEFAGDVRSWEPQVREFARTYRCIPFNARGYPPSDVPGDVKYYSQERARDDIRAVLDALAVGGEAGIVGELCAPRRFAKLAIQVVVAAGENHIAVRGAKRLVGHDVRMQVADTLGRHAGRKVVGVLVREQRNL